MQQSQQHKGRRKTDYDETQLRSIKAKQREGKQKTIPFHLHPAGRGSSTQRSKAEEPTQAKHANKREKGPVRDQRMPRS
eukprot:scaffold910_cov168-Ochromonas_danica.AAC.7